jgi:hypothetical protein
MSREQTDPPGTYQSPAFDPVTTYDEPRDEFESDELLPSRPRRRLLAPLPVTLLVILMTGVGFLGGVALEKGEGSPTSSTAESGSSLASTLATPRGNKSKKAGGGKSSAKAAGGAAGSLAGLGGTGSGSAAVGAVAYLEGSTLYVTTTEGNTVKITSTPASTVSKTVTSSVKAIHPGETVTVTGSSGKNGSISAEAINVGAPRAGSGAGKGGKRGRKRALEALLGGGE